jgi:serine/threonine protein kinase
VRLLQSLDHPNIIKYYDSFINETDHLIIIVEWAAAGDLKRQLRKAQEKQVGFEERIIWKYFSQIADAIQHMHERRIMHRDLKPANILLTLDGTVKVGDLGLSRELSENTYQAHSKVGTPLYMSPEVLRGDGYDFKSDIWSIGCLLYELAMLKSPFKSEGLNMFSLFQKISQGEYSPLPDRYSEELRNLAYAMISTNPTERPEIADICEISRNMRLKCNEEYAREKKNQNSSKTQVISNAETIQDHQKNNTSRQLVSNQEEHSDENREDNWQHSARNSARDVKRSQSPQDLPPKVAGRSDHNRVAARVVRGSFGADSDDSDATHDRKSNQMKTNSNSQVNGISPEKQERSPVDNTNHRQSNSNQNSDRKFSGGRESSEQQEKRRSSKPPPQKPNFHPRSNPEERDETYIPYTSLPSHEQTPLRQPTTQSGQPSHRRVKEKTNDHEHPKRELSAHRAQNFDTPSNEQVSKKSTVLESIGGTLAVMDLIYSKLSILGYPVSSDPTNDPTSSHSRCRISSLHFVCELSLLYGNRNRITFPSTQFGTFVEVSLWLMEQSSTKPFVPGIDIDHDAPPMIAKRLLNLAQVSILFLPPPLNCLPSRNVGSLHQSWPTSIPAPWLKDMASRLVSSSTFSLTPQ